MKRNKKVSLKIIIIALAPLVAVALMKGYISLRSRADFDDAHIVISPERLEADIASQGLVDILLLSNGNSLYGGDVKLSYNPADLTVLGFDQNVDSGFGTYIVDWDNNLGTVDISFAAFNNGSPTPPVFSENPINLGQLRFQALGGSTSPVLTVVYTANNASSDSNLVADDNGEPLDVLGEPTTSLSFYHKVCRSPSASNPTLQCVEEEGAGLSACTGNDDCGTFSPAPPGGGRTLPGTGDDTGKPPVTIKAYYVCNEKTWQCMPVSSCRETAKIKCFESKKECRESCVSNQEDIKEEIKKEVTPAELGEEEKR
ncbi:MAG: cohesin domain-containing protein [bacterium]